MTRFHLFAHRQWSVALAQRLGGMDNYIAPFESLDGAKASLEQMNAELVATKGGTAKYDYAQVAALSDSGRLIVVATFDATTGWTASSTTDCDDAACSDSGPLKGYIVRRPVQDRARIAFDVIGDIEDVPMGYVLVENPRQGEEIYHGHFNPRIQVSGIRSCFGPGQSAQPTVYDPVGAFTTTRFGE